ncbi:MAG: 3-keto-5-aminohexanoate cleavage protein [Pseudomonadota bacterium]
MIVQACLNGTRESSYHPRLPLTAQAIARDAAECVLQGAAELHIHPRADDGRESLAVVSDTVLSVRRACPGTLVGVSTGDWIEADAKGTRDRIAAWKTLPDYASVNLSEPDAPAVMALLHQRGIGVEAGLANAADADRFIAQPDSHRVFRILIEIPDQNIEKADAVTDEIAAILDRADINRPILLHGFDATVWHFVRRAYRERWSTRVGLEDGRELPDGKTAASNAEIVACAVRIFRAHLH